MKNMKSKKYIEEAGAIVVRILQEEPEVLLIFSKKEPKVRIFPKGHIEKGENPAEAATRELLEEAGIKGKLIREVGTIEYESRKKFYRVTYFLFNYVEKISDGEEGRDPRWFFWKDVITLLPSNELATLLKQVIVEEKKNKREQNHN